MSGLAITLARADGAHGEVVLRRRGDVVELIVDGVFAMDTVDSTTEEGLATLALERLPADAVDLAILIGGLGLGRTLCRVLADSRVRRVLVAELQGALVEWVRTGLVPTAAGLLDDPRVLVHVGDVREAVAAATPASLDALLLDVDNGPGFLVHASNADLYAAPFLRLAGSRLRPGGVLAVWSADPAPTLARTLADAVGACTEVLGAVERDGRRLTYATYLAVPHAQHDR